MSKERRDVKIQQQREKDAERQRTGLGRSRIHDPMAINASGDNDDDEDISQQKKVKNFPLKKHTCILRMYLNGSNMLLLVVKLHMDDAQQ